MNYTDLENIWDDSNEQLDQELTINKASINQLDMKKVQANLSETKWENLIELGVNILFVGFFKDFCLNHLSTPKFLIPGTFMLIMSVLAILLCSYKLYLLSKINRAYPILKAQRNIALVQYFNRIEINTLFILIPVFSLAFIIVGAKGTIGLDLYAINFPFFSYLAGSFMVGLIIVILMKLFPDKKLKETINYLSELKEIR